MGFGLLLVGYTLVLCMSAYTALPAFIGYYIMMYACFKLAEYEDRFSRAAWVMGAAACFSMVQSVVGVLDITSGNTVLADISADAQPVFELVFYSAQFMLLPALAAIAKETGRKKTEYACKRNMVLLLLMFVLYIVSNILIGNQFEYSRYLILYLMISRYIVLILMMVQVFSCYMWICREGEEEREQEEAESKFNKHFTGAFGRKKKTAEASEEEQELPAWRKVQNKRKRK